MHKTLEAEHHRPGCRAGSRLRDSLSILMPSDVFSRDLLNGSTLFPHSEYRPCLLGILFLRSAALWRAHFREEEHHLCRRRAGVRTKRSRPNARQLQSAWYNAHHSFARYRSTYSLTLGTLYAYWSRPDFGHISHFLTNCRVKRGADLPLVWVTVTQVVFGEKWCPAVTESHLSWMTE